MTIHVNQQEAEQKFSQLLGYVLQGEEVAIFVEGQEIARLVPSLSHQVSHQPRVPGIDEGRFTVPDDFDDPLPEEVLDTFLASNLPS